MIQSKSMSKNYFLKIKLDDFVRVSTILPLNIKIGGKMFAKGLGDSAGKLMKIYNLIYTEIGLGKKTEDIEVSVRKLLCKESKIEFKLLWSNPKNVRICGLVALNYTDFFKLEIQLYQLLFRILAENKDTDLRLENLIKKEIMSNREEMKLILKRKSQAIHDFSVLMGITNDSARFESLTKSMHSKIANYFRKAVTLHRGNFLVPSWPIPFRKYAETIEKSLFFDSISFMLQKELGEDYCFEDTFSEKREAQLNMIKKDINNFSEKFYLKFYKNKLNFFNKLQLLSIAPVTLLYLTGIESQIPELSESIQNANIIEMTGAAPAVGATTIAAVLNSCCGSDITSGWTIAFSTLIPIFTN